jgi:hypothetical protein
MHLTTLNESEKSCPSGWRTSRLFGLALTSDFPFVTVLPCATGTPDLRFTCAPEPPLRPDWPSLAPVYVNPRRQANGENLVALYDLNECEVLRFPGSADFYLWPDHIVCHLTTPGAELQAEMQFLGTVLAFWLERRAVAALHAASVVVADRAVAFVGSRHRGKSSLAATFVRAGHALLTDDLLSIRWQDGRFLGQPGYPHMRLWPEQAQHFLGYYETLDVVHPAYNKRRVPLQKFGTFCEQPQPLVAVYIVERRHPTQHGTSIEIIPLSRAEALLALIRYCFAAQLLKAVAHQQHRMALLAPLVLRLPVRRLAFPSGFDYLPGVRQAILDDLQAVS